MAKAKSDYPREKGFGKLPGGEHIKTCPASRHAAMICDWLRDPKWEGRKALIEAGYEPDHWASSIEVVIQSLWEARRYLEWQKLPPTKRYRYNGHWVPIPTSLTPGSA